MASISAPEPSLALQCYGRYGPLRVMLRAEPPPLLTLRANARARMRVQQTIAPHNTCVSRAYRTPRNARNMSNLKASPRNSARNGPVTVPSWRVC